MRVKKYLALTLVALFAATMLTACPWDIEDDAASDSSSAPSSSSRPSHDSSDDDSGSAPSSPSTPDDEASENPGDEESEKPTPTEIIEKYGTVKGDTLTLTTGKLYNDFRNALNNAPTIKKIVFGADVASISSSAFDSCTNLTSVALGNVTEIKMNAFHGCTSLTSIDLSKVKTIGQQAFDGCTSLTSVDLISVTYIETSAFLDCTNLAHIRLGESMKEYSDDDPLIAPTGVSPDAFYGIASKVHVYYGKDKNEAATKWTSLNVTPSGTQVEYHPANDWEKRENDDNAAEVLPDAMKGLLALAERLG